MDNCPHCTAVENGEWNPRAPNEEGVRVLTKKQIDHFDELAWCWRQDDLYWGDAIPGISATLQAHGCQIMDLYIDEEND